MQALVPEKPRSVRLRQQKGGRTIIFVMNVPFGGLQIDMGYLKF